MDPGQKRIVNWLGDRVISGDIIVEQNVHVLDMANWYLGSHPLKAAGAGGRTSWAGTKSDTGDAWDHFAITFWYPGEVHATFSSHQLAGRLSKRGCRSTMPINNAATAVESNLTGILGRTPAYHGGVVTREEMMASSEKWEAGLKLKW
jgi:myo-inositol 2-dehydrogenase / D-chiro-inositol 1-dehydrogenase